MPLREGRKMRLATDWSRPRVFADRRACAATAGPLEPRAGTGGTVPVPVAARVVVCQCATGQETAPPFGLVRPQLIVSPMLAASQQLRHLPAVTYAGQTWRWGKLLACSNAPACFPPARRPPPLPRPPPQLRGTAGRLRAPHRPDPRHRPARAARPRQPAAAAPHRPACRARPRVRHGHAGHLAGGRHRGAAGHELPARRAGPRVPGRRHWPGACGAAGPAGCAAAARSVPRAACHTRTPRAPPCRRRSLAQRRPSGSRALRARTGRPCSSCSPRPHHPRAPRHPRPHPPAACPRSSRSSTPPL